MTERWRRIAAHPDYVVSDRGRVASLDRLVVDSLGRKSRKKGQILKQKTDKDGHKAVRLGLYQPLEYVHVLVLKTFVGPRPFKGAEGCHGNGIPGDNRLENLRWDTRSANSRDALKHGTHTSIVRKRHPMKNPPKNIEGLPQTQL